MLHVFALVVDGDVFQVMRMEDENPIAAKWAAALDDDIYFVKVDNYNQVVPGFHYKDGFFYNSEDIEMLNPISNEESDPNFIRYAGVIGNDIIGLMTVVISEVGLEKAEMIDAGMQSNPTIINATKHRSKVLISPGWTWDGTEFYPGVI